MKFINYLEKILGVDVYALTSLLIFFLFFVGVALWVWKADKKTMQKNSNIPLEDSRHI